MTGAEQLNELAYLSGWVVAAVLGWAGVAKIGQPDVVAQRFRALGLGSASTSLALAVPPIELIVALALVTAPSIGGVLAALLLAGFTTVLVSVVRRDVGIGCACFGGVSDRPVAGSICSATPPSSEPRCLRRPPRSPDPRCRPW